MRIGRFNKYKVAPKEDRTIDGITFASKREMTRWLELNLLVKAKEISDLHRQITFDIQVNQEHICKYIADFTYIERGKQIVEELKGFETPEFKLKWKLCQALWPHFVWKITK